MGTICGKGSAPLGDYGKATPFLAGRRMGFLFLAKYPFPKGSLARSAIDSLWVQSSITNKYYFSIKPLF
jgi:hypothetical protein